MYSQFHIMQSDKRLYNSLSTPYYISLFINYIIFFSFTIFESYAIIMEVEKTQSGPVLNTCRVNISENKTGPFLEHPKLQAPSDHKNERLL